MAQFGRPNSNITQTNWSGGFGTIDETSYSDADYITGATNANGTAEYGLSSVFDIGLGTGHIVRFRAWQQNNTKVRTLQAYLVEGTTVRSTYPSTITLVKGTPTAYSWTLSEAEANSITDYTNLRVRFVSGGDVGTPSAQRSAVYVSWSELEVPGTAAVSSRSAYLKGTASTTSSEHVWLSGSINSSANTPAYTTGAAASASTSISSYIVGLSDIQRSSTHAYILGGGVVEYEGDTSTVVYVCGSDDANTSINSYIFGFSSALSNLSSYLRGQAYAPELGIINIDHEIGDLSQYTSTVDPDGDELNVTEAAALAGTGHGLAVTIDDTDALYGVYDLASANTSGIVRLRFYIDPNSLTMANGNSFYLVSFQTSAAVYFAYLYLTYNTTTYYNILCNLVNDASGNNYSNYLPISDAPHYIEVIIVRATNSTSNDGSLQIWIDGVDSDTISGIDNYDKFANFDKLQIGAISGVDTGTTGTFYLDELIVNDDGSEIGPVSWRKKAFLAGSSVTTLAISVYARGASDLSISQLAYISGQGTAFSNIGAFLNGSVGSANTLIAFLSGKANIATDTLAYLGGADSQIGFLVAYTCGAASTDTAQHAYMAADAVLQSQVPVYALGYSANATGTRAYLVGKSETLESIAAYAFGNIEVSFSLGAYLHGRQSSQGSISAYSRGLAYAPEIGIININHETGNLSQYTSTVDPDGDELNVTEAAALAGSSYGLAVTIDDTDALYGVYDLATANTSGVVRVRFYIDPNSLTMANTNEFGLLYLYNSSAALILIAALYYTTAGGYQIRSWTYDDAGTGRYTSYGSITDAPHYIEILLTRAATVNSNDGSLTLWIDGAQVSTRSDLDNNTRFDSLDIVRLGATGGVDAGTTGTFYLDELIINDDGTEIGPAAWRKQAFLVGSTNAASSIYSFLTGDAALTAQCASYTLGLANAATSNTALVVGLDTSLGNISAFLIGDLSASQSVYLIGKDTGISSAFSYISGTDTNDSNQIAYLCGGIVSTTSLIAFLRGQREIKMVGYVEFPSAPVFDDFNRPNQSGMPISQEWNYYDGIPDSATITDNKLYNGTLGIDEYLKAQTGDNIEVYLDIDSELISNFATAVLYLGLKGWDYQTFCSYSVSPLAKRLIVAISINGVSGGSYYVDLEFTPTSIGVRWVDEKIYLYYRMVGDNTWYFWRSLSVGFTASGLLEFYVSPNAYGYGWVSIDNFGYSEIDEYPSRPAYLYGSSGAYSSTSAFVCGRSDAQDMSPACIRGSINTSSAQTAYIPVDATLQSQFSAYVFGYSANASAIIAFAVGQGICTGGITAFLVGGLAISAPVYLAGKSTCASSITAYISGVDASEGNLIAYLRGGISFAANCAAYLRGQKEARMVGLAEFPVAPIFDNFNRPDQSGVPISPAWYYYGGYQDSATIVDNRLYNGIEGIDEYLKDRTGDNIEVYVDLEAECLHNSESIVIYFGLKDWDYLNYCSIAVHPKLNTLTLRIKEDGYLWSTTVTLPSRLLSIGARFANQIVYVYYRLVGDSTWYSWKSAPVAFTASGWLEFNVSINAYGYGWIYADNFGYGEIDYPSQPVFLGGCINTTTAIAAFAGGSLTVGAQQSNYLRGQADSSAYLTASISGQDHFDSQAPTYLCGQDYSIGSCFAFTAGKFTIESSSPAYLYGRADTQTNQPVYIQGYLDNQSATRAYIVGNQTDASVQPAYTSGLLRSSALAFLHGSVSVYNSLNAYVHGLDSTSHNLSAYLHGSVGSLSEKQAFVHGQIDTSALAYIYTCGAQTTISNTAVYTSGSLQQYSSQQCYLCGSLDTDGFVQAFAHGSAFTSNSTFAYLFGYLANEAMCAAYTRGKNSESSAGAAYLFGGIAFSGSVSTYLAGQSSNCASISAYLAGKSDSVSAVFVYISGLSDAQDGTLVYLAGVDTCASNQHGYLAGGEQISTMVHSYISGIALSTSNTAVFIAGHSGNETSVHCYINGSYGVLDITPDPADTTTGVDDPNISIGFVLLLFRLTTFAAVSYKASTYITSNITIQTESGKQFLKETYLP